ncbi:Pantothenate synthetase [Corynebacterium atrinae]|uniref:pantoate--beta-alanine ligase n=1 Tax=Corynebacterium atrinae TaxID=1336740 RepID=UPI0025B61225|nr:pantoate--beta-alanine ligase [Corynebacterium atrinae]WJY64357.1 Pantothenate synthetase [Corynebacterium atrinae]
MSFEFGQAQEFSTERISIFARAMRKTGRPVVLVPLGVGLHAGHIALIRAARRLPRAVVIVAWAGTEVPEELKSEQVDAVWRYTVAELWPKGLRTVIQPVDHHLEPVSDLARVLTQQIAELNIVGPSDVFVGEKDYEQIRALQSAVTDLHLPVTVHGVPTVRMPDGIALSLRNTQVDEAAREQALALSAALTAGAHAAEHGADAVLSAARSVLDTAGIEPEYLAVRGLELGEAEETGDARLLVAATVGGVRLIDNVGLPLGVGFRNLGQDA